MCHIPGGKTALRIKWVGRVAPDVEITPTKHSSRQFTEMLVVKQL